MLSYTTPNNLPTKLQKNANRAQKGALRRCDQTGKESCFIRVITLRARNRRSVDGRAEVDFVTEVIEMLEVKIWC